MDVQAVKWIGVASIGLSGIVFGLLPMKIKQTTNAAKILALSNCMGTQIVPFVSQALAGGVFLGAGLLHLLPDAEKLTETYHEMLMGPNNFPTAQAIAVLSFLLILYLEHVLLANNPGAHKHHDYGAIEPEHQRKSVSVAVEQDLIRGLRSFSWTPDDVIDPELLIGKGVEMNTSVSGNEQDTVGITNTVNTEADELGPVIVKPMEDNHVDDEDNDGKVGIGPYLVAVVLSIHSFIEGLALGSSSSFDTTLSVFLAIIAHKWSEAFAVGVSLVKEDGIKKGVFVSLISIYAGMTPLGIVVGLATTAMAGHGLAGLLEAIFSSIAVGTFVYVATLEILAPEFENHTMAKSKFMATVVGVAIMAAVKYWD